MKKVFIEKYKYSIVIAISYYILPFLVYVVPVEDPFDRAIFDRAILFAYIVIAVIPLILLVLSIIFAMSNKFHWYFSFRIFILCLAYMLFTGIGILMFCVGYFIVSVIGQCIGAFIREHKL